MNQAMNRTMNLAKPRWKRVLILVWVGLLQYLRNILVWLDQGVNVLFLGGDEDETISSITGKFYRQYPALAWLRRLLNTVDPGHTEKTREDDEGKNSVWAVVRRKHTELQQKL